MAHSREHLRRTEELDRREPAPPRRPPAAERLLELQRSAGNRAVGEYLAREPEPADAKEETKATGPRVTLPGIGTIPLLSVGFPPGEGGVGDGKSPGPRELIMSSAVGKHSSQLSKAMLDGRTMDVEVVLAGGRTVTLHGAIVSSYTTSGDRESWTLNFTAIDQPE